MSPPKNLPAGHSAPAGAVSDETVRCGNFLVDPVTRRLRTADGAAVAIGARALDLLLALIRGHGQPVSGEHLRAQVWPGRLMADNNLRVQLTLLRRLLGREAVAYLPGQGYRLTVPVERLSLDPADSASPAGQLPEALWPVLGRDEHLQRLGPQIQAGGRLTLVAGGGIGKTTLALALAQGCGQRFQDGAWWIDLAPLRDPQELPRQVAATLGLPVMRERALEQLGHALSSWTALLVLDNCEHLRAAACELADRLLRAAPRVALLATSRVALGCAGEQLEPLPPLPVPATDAAWAALRSSGALRLFEARVQAADPRFTLRPENVQRVADICRRLDGNAFAITLAAAQVPIMGLQWVHDSLGERLHWRKRLPGSAQDPQHHQSLAATLDWSVALLREPAQRLLERLGVVTGAVEPGLIQALAACGEPLAPREVAPAVEALVTHGLLRLDASSLQGTAPTQSGQTAGYLMHESVRLYARERLAASEAWASAHEALCGWLLAQLGGAGTAVAPLPAPERVWRLSNDVQTAVVWATQARPALAAPLIRRCLFGWRRFGQHGLGKRLAQALLEQAGADALPTELYFGLLDALCGVEWELEEHDSVLARTRAMLARLDADTELPSRQRLLMGAQARSWQANVLCYRDVVAAEALFREVLQTCRETDDRHGVLEGLNNLGWALQDQGRFDEARPLLQEALQRSLDDGDDWSLMVSLENLGELALNAGQPQQAIEHFAREAELARRLPDLFRRGQALVSLVQSQLACDPALAELGLLVEALRTAQQQGFRRLQCHAVSVATLWLARRGDLGRAEALRVFSQRLHRQLGLPACRASLRAEDEVQALAQRLLGPAAQRAAAAQGELMTLDELVKTLAQRLGDPLRTAGNPAAS